MPPSFAAYAPADDARRDSKLAWKDSTVLQQSGTPTRPSSGGSPGWKIPAGGSTLQRIDEPLNLQPERHRFARSRPTSAGPHARAHVQSIAKHSKEVLAEKVFALQSELNTVAAENKLLRTHEQQLASEIKALSHNAGPPSPTLAVRPWTAGPRSKTPAASGPRPVVTNPRAAGPDIYGQTSIPHIVQNLKAKNLEVRKERDEALRCLKELRLHTRTTRVAELEKERHTMLGEVQRLHHLNSTLSHRMQAQHQAAEHEIGNMQHMLRASQTQLRRYQEVSSPPGRGLGSGAWGAHARRGGGGAGVSLQDHVDQALDNLGGVVDSARAVLTAKPLQPQSPSKADRTDALSALETLDERLQSMVSHLRDLQREAGLPMASRRVQTQSKSVKQCDHRSRRVHVERARPAKTVEQQLQELHQPMALAVSSLRKLSPVEFADNEAIQSNTRALQHLISLFIQQHIALDPTVIAGEAEPEPEAPSQAWTASPAPAAEPGAGPPHLLLHGSHHAPGDNGAQAYPAQPSVLPHASTILTSATEAVSAAPQGKSSDAASSPMTGADLAMHAAADAYRRSYGARDDHAALQATGPADEHTSVTAVASAPLAVDHSALASRAAAAAADDAVSDEYVEDVVDEDEQGDYEARSDDSYDDESHESEALHADEQEVEEAPESEAAAFAAAPEPAHVAHLPEMDTTTVAASDIGDVRDASFEGTVQSSIAPAAPPVSPPADEPSLRLAEDAAAAAGLSGPGAEAAVARSSENASDVGDSEPLYADGSDEAPTSVGDFTDEHTEGVHELDADRQSMPVAHVASTTDPDPADAVHAAVFEESDHDVEELDGFVEEDVRVSDDGADPPLDIAQDSADVTTTPTGVPEAASIDARTDFESAEVDQMGDDDMSAGSYRCEDSPSDAGRVSIGADAVQAEKTAAHIATPDIDQDEAARESSKSHSYDGTGTSDMASNDLDDVMHNMMPSGLSASTSLAATDSNITIAPPSSAPTPAGAAAPSLHAERSSAAQDVRTTSATDAIESVINGCVPDSLDPSLTGEPVQHEQHEQLEVLRESFEGDVVEPLCSDDELEALDDELMDLADTADLIDDSPTV